jgi:peptide/nickel transport system substrate-binding protein
MNEQALRELKSVTPSVYFSSDAANPDTARTFYADIQMLTTGVGAPPDPEGLMRQFLSSEIAAKENKWERGNATRWRNVSERRSSLR